MSRTHVYYKEGHTEDKNFLTFTFFAIHIKQSISSSLSTVPWTHLRSCTLVLLTNAPEAAVAKKIFIKHYNEYNTRNKLTALGIEGPANLMSKISPPPKRFDFFQSLAITERFQSDALIPCRPHLHPKQLLHHHDKNCSQPLNGFTPSKPCHLDDFPPLYLIVLGSF